MISLEKLMILTPLQELPKNVGDLDKLTVATGLEKLPKVQLIAQSGHTVCDVPIVLQPSTPMTKHAPPSPSFITSFVTTAFLTEEIFPETCRLDCEALKFACNECDQIKIAKCL